LLHYRATAAAIVESNLSRFWEAIGLPARTENVTLLELSAYSALKQGIKVEYLEWVLEQAEWQSDVSFMDELADREKLATAEKLSNDVLFREAMRSAGFDVPYPNKTG